jgi:hypothetical protein
MKNNFEKAMDNYYQIDSTFKNINKSIKLAKKIKVYDIINSSSREISILAEIVSRLQNSDELEILAEQRGRIEA